MFHPMKLYSHGKSCCSYQSMLKIDKSIKLKKKKKSVKANTLHTSITVYKKGMRMKEMESPKPQYRSLLLHSTNCWFGKTKALLKRKILGLQFLMLHENRWYYPFAEPINTYLELDENFVYTLLLSPYHFYSLSTFPSEFYLFGSICSFANCNNSVAFLWYDRNSW